MEVRGQPSSTIVRHSGAHSSAAQSPPGGWCGSTAPRRPRAGGVARFGDGAVGIVAGDVGHPDQAVGRVRAEVGEPVVVRGVPGPHEFRVATRERRAHGGAEQHLGVDAVDVLVLHAWAGIPPAGADLAEPAHAHRVVLGATAGGGGERHHRLPLSLEDLEVALVGALDRRRPVAELGGEVLSPHLRRRVHVRVRRHRPERSFAHELPPALVRAVTSILDSPSCPVNPSVGWATAHHANLRQQTAYSPRS